VALATLAARQENGNAAVGSIQLDCPPRQQDDDAGLSEAEAQELAAALGFELA
jgi:hypothetical protein